MKPLQVLLICLFIAGCASTSPVELVATASAAKTQAAEPVLPATPGLDPQPTVPPTVLPPTAIPTTAIPPAADPVLVGAGDIAFCENNGAEQTASLIDNIPGTVFTTGDNAYPHGTFEQFINCYDPTWGRFKDRTFPSAGNHDYGTAGAEGYFRYFGSAAGNPGEGYYSYELGTWHIIVLNSSISVASGSPQEQWLWADLAAHPAACTLAYWHVPLFSSGSLHGSDPTMKPIWQALYEYGADVVLNGHEHNYERFEPQTPDGIPDPARGIREFVIGTGGMYRYSFGAPIANSAVRNSETYGVLKLTLHPGSYSWEFIPVAGETFTNSGTAPCVEAVP